MDINELMVDNYLSWGEDKIVKVQMLRKYKDKVGIEVLCNNNVNLWFSSDNDDIHSLDIEELKPLELTKEIILNNGFKFTDPWFYDEECPIAIEKGYDTKWIASKTGSINYAFNYVHELQNIMNVFKVGKQITLEFGLKKESD